MFGAVKYSLSPKVCGILGFAPLSLLLRFGVLFDGILVSGAV